MNAAHPGCPATQALAAVPAATEEANAAFLRLAYPGTRVWWGAHTGEWWGMPPAARQLMHHATIDGLAVQFALAAQPGRRHPPP